jgi:hypothetical protein
MCSLVASEVPLDTTIAAPVPNDNDEGQMTHHGMGASQASQGRAADAEGYEGLYWRRASCRGEYALRGQPLTAERRWRDRSHPQSHVNFAAEAK